MFDNKTIEKILFVLIVSLNTLHAGLGDFLTADPKPLIGFEGGYSSISIDTNRNLIIPGNNSGETSDYSAAELGFKLGTQGRNYRAFATARNYFVGDELNYLATFGVELQYLFNIHPMMNIFLGLNAGYLMSELKISDENSKRDFDGAYFGGDIGVNYHITSDYDLEFGIHYVTSDAEDDTTAIKYQFDSMWSGYVSFIIPFTLD